MPDQVADKRTVGIAPDILDVRKQTKEYMDLAASSAGTSEGYSRSASASAERSAASESAAAEWARQSAEWAVLRNQGIEFGPTEPPVKIDGMLWLRTDEDDQTITDFGRWDANAAGAGLFPAEDTWPGEGTHPSEQGEWKHFRVAASAVA